jgi:hypothetical protein
VECIAADPAHFAEILNPTFTRVTELHLLNEGLDSLLWEAYRNCFHDFSFSLRFREVSHVEGSSLTTSLRYQTSAFYEISKPKVD